FFGLSSTDGGRRVVIVDSIDDMNPSAANALLKVLEEPPKNALLLLISHAPARLLPTIRSRCRELRLPALAPDALSQALAQAGHTDPDPALTQLAAGSVGEAIRLATQNGPALYAEILALLATCPTLDRPRVLKFTDHITQRGQDDRLAVALNLLDLALSRLARTGTGLAPEPATPNELEILKRLAPDPKAAQKWASLQQQLSQRIGHGRAVNVDAQSLVLDAFLKINETASRP
ncbi:MAG: DNA polymerase III subunit delta', partial [Boseongicola sp.]|nr:DNA polymerase III subunit delta' [Boseongicola sp.]